MNKFFVLSLLAAICVAANARPETQVTDARSFAEKVRDTLTYPFRVINDKFDSSDYQSDLDKAKEKGADALKEYVDKLKSDLDKAEKTYNELEADAKKDSQSLYQQFRDKLTEMEKSAQEFYEKAKDRIVD